MDPRLIIAGTVLGAMFIRDEIALIKNRRHLNEMQEVCNTASQIMKDDQNTIEYLIHLINKYQTPLDEFDRVALKQLGVTTQEKERPE